MRTLVGLNDSVAIVGSTAEPNLGATMVSIPAASCYGPSVVGHVGLCYQRGVVLGTEQYQG
jgi:hypothetical protein